MRTSTDESATLAKAGMQSKSAQPKHHIHRNASAKFVGTRLMNISTACVHTAVAAESKRRHRRPRPHLHQSFPHRQAWVRDQFALRFTPLVIPGPPNCGLPEQLPSSYTGVLSPASGP